MAAPQPISRFWLVELEPQEAQIRCIHHRAGRRMTGFAVQLEIDYRGGWTPVVRYDNAHGFCHRDTIHPDGTQDKTRVFVGDLNETFTQAIAEVKANWRDHRSRFLSEVQP
jgi:hypothetical protein